MQKRIVVAAAILVTAATSLNAQRLKLAPQGPPPTGLTVTGTQSTATLTWAAPAGATGFVVYRAVTPSGNWTMLTTTLVTATSFVDQTGFRYETSYQYRVEAYFASGPTGYADVNFQPPPPVDPAWVRAVLQGKDVVVTWAPVPGATRYYVTSHESMFRDLPAPATSVTYPNLAPGTYNIHVGGYFGPEMMTPGPWPGATVTVPASGRYRIMLNGAHVVAPTSDDALSRDGKGDEVEFVNVVEVFDRGAGTPKRRQRLQVPSPKTPRLNYGDVSVDRNRIQAGTFSSSGGLGAGDWIPMGQNGFAPYAPPAAVGLPMLLWDGVLTDGREVLLVHPSVIEIEGGSNDSEFDHSSTLCPPDLLFNTPSVQQEIGRPGIGTAIVVPVLSRQAKCLRPLEFRFDALYGEGARPIGLLAGINDPNAYISADAYVVLSREKIEAALGRQSWMTFAVDRVDQFRGGNGHYRLILLVERLP